MYAVLDLVDEMQWEDCVDFLTLEEAGLEEEGKHPCFDLNPAQDCIAYFSDGEDSRYEMN